MSQPNNNNKLPPEILVKIFEHCDLNELVNIVDVCQLWRDVVIHQHMSRNNLVIRRPSDINDLVNLLCKPVSFTKLHVVWDVPEDVDCSSVYQMQDVTEDVQHNKQIKFFSNPFQYLTARLFRRTMPRHVDCSSVSLDALTDATSLTRLQSFMFSVEDRGYNYDYNEFISNKENEYHKVLDVLLTLLLQTSTDTLTHLKLFGSVTARPKCSKAVELLQGCHHLSHLVLNSCNLQGYELRIRKTIPTLTHLEFLDLRGTELPPWLSFIADVKRGCPNISNNIMIGGLEIEPSDDLSMLQFVSHVGSLDIEEFDTEQLRSLISSLNERASQLNVNRLRVSMCLRVTDDILLSLVQRLRGLKYIDAAVCRHLTNDGVVNVITASPQLERINIYGITNIDTHIIDLLDDVVTGQNLSISADCTNIGGPTRNVPQRELYTGKNRNIHLRF